MFKLNVLFAFLIVALASCVLAATPPACVLACVNEQPKVSDIEAVCAASSSQQCLFDACDSSEYNSAVEYFDGICKAGGHKIADAFKPSGTSSGSRASATHSGSSASGSTSTAAAESASASGKPSSAGNRATAPVYAVFGAAMALYVLA